VNRIYKIIVNGPASSGKSSAALELSLALGFVFMSTGNVYRSYAWALQREGITTYSQTVCLKVMKSYTFEYVNKSVFYKGKDIANEIGVEEIGFKAANLARKQWYRNFMNNNIILPFIRNRSFVIEGRGLTEIVPDPDVNFFLKSTVFARANRRARQYKKKFGVSNVSFGSIYKQIYDRDKLDTDRKIAPLRTEKGSKVINNSKIKRLETVHRMVNIVRKRFPELPIKWKMIGSTK